ncbi:tetratricopeptide repeat protein [Oceanihabitans sediminis]|uniref:Tetratricopeptide repeat protein n=2 Tax=Pseudomonadati TaxID=3379134 RepID=A0A368P4H3_9FLAO|nr:tetratricopeptide repeat protein [Oceanihabitans sediminis]MDX1278207.1 tetratricopeptide repeat protein [Oceanihabitans sediminis]MDX1773712.1 tetratricopeptide repeat protein [Oceanihabitans sediminis]RBP33157.1 tetratricopeptide repeat protein [Oceanihabitans sediminis]RCU57336.1 tetratricopeptide repeat protein [Oceanihabitans sediminis]
MKKQAIIALALGVSAFSFAQKKELKSAEKAINKNNFSEATSLLNEVESMLPEMDGKLADKYYYLKGLAIYANGQGNEKVDEIIANFDKVKGAYETEIADTKQNIVNTILTKSNDLYQSAKYVEASKGFKKLYKLVPADTTYLYYAAASAVSGNDYDAAAENYEELIKLGYTGIEKQYSAVNKETGEVEFFPKSQRDLFVRTGSHIKPAETLTKSRRGEIIKNIAFIYLSQDKTEKALAAIQNARKMDPNDANLIVNEANIYYKNGDQKKYKELIEQAIELDPTNIDLIFNLGVVAAENGETEKAKEYYKKVIEMDPTYVNAQTNMAALILSGENALIEEMNGLGTSNADNIRYDQLKEERTQLYRNSIPYLESVLKIQPDNIDVARTLMNIYSAIDDTVKTKEMRALIQSLEKN